MPGGGFRAWAATAPMAGPPTAAMVAAASRQACESGAPSRGGGPVELGPESDGTQPTLTRAAVSSPPRRSVAVAGAWRTAVAAGARFASDPGGAVTGTRGSSPPPTGVVKEGGVLPAGLGGTMSGATLPSSTIVTPPSGRARGAAVWAWRLWPVVAEGAPTECVSAPPAGGAEDDATAGGRSLAPTVSGTGVAVRDMARVTPAMVGPAAAASQTATVSAKVAFAGENTFRPVLPTCWAFSLESSHLDSTCRLAQAVPEPLGPLQPSPETPKQKK